MPHTLEQDTGTSIPEKKTTQRKWLWRVLFLLLILLLLPAALWLALPLYWQTINPLLRNTAGVSLSIESISTGFDGINPYISLKNAKLYSDHANNENKTSKPLWYPKSINLQASVPLALLQVNRASITVALNSISSLKPVFKQATIDQLTIHGWQDPDQNYWIAGFKISPSQDDTPIDWLWIRKQQAQINHAQLIWHSAASTAIQLPMTLVDIPVLSVIKTPQGHQVQAKIIPNKHLGEPIELEGSLAHSTQMLNGQGRLDIPLVQIRHISDIFFLPNSAAKALQLIDTVSAQGNLSWTPNKENISELSANLDTTITPHAFTSKLTSSKRFTITAQASAKHQGTQSILQRANIVAQFNNWLGATASMSQPTEKPAYTLDLSIPAVYMDKLMDELNDFGLLNSLPAELQTKQWIGEIENISAHVSGLSLQHQLEYQSASAGLFIQSIGWKDPIITGGVNLQAQPKIIKNKAATSHQVDVTWNLETIHLPAFGSLLTQLLQGTGKKWAEQAFKTGEINTLTGGVNFTLNDKTNQIAELQAQAHAQIKQLGLNYWSTYPAVDEADGTLNLSYNKKTKTHDAKLQVKSGKILEYQLAPSTVEFLSIEKNSLLQVKANASGDASNLFNFVQQAPLPDVIKNATDGFSGTGKSSLQFQMDLPIGGNTNARMAIATHASFASTNFNHKQWGSFTLSGDAGWANDKVYSLSGLKARANLGQINIEAFDTLKTSKRSTLRANGYLVYGETLSLLNRLGQNTDQIRYVLKGADQSKIGFDLETQAQIDLWLNNRLNLDLSELAIDIPTLINKPNKTPLNLSLNIQKNILSKTSSSATVSMSVKLTQPNQAPILDIAYELDKRDLKRVHSGHISIGRAFGLAEPNSLLVPPGDKRMSSSQTSDDASEMVHTVTADVFSPEFDLDQLRQWFSNMPSRKNKEEETSSFHPDQLQAWASTLGTSIDKITPYRGFIPTQWTIKTTNLVYQKNKTGLLNIEIISSTKHAKMQIQHKNMDGFLEWRDNQGKQTVVGRFQRLAITTQSASQPTETKTTSKKNNTEKGFEKGTTEKNTKDKSNTPDEPGGLEKTKQAFKPWQEELLRWSAQPIMDASIDIEIDQVLVGKENLGQFSIKGQAFKPEPERELVGFVFDEISLNGSKTQININGHWYHQPKKAPSVQLAINIQSSDFGEFLATIGQPKILKDGQTQLQFIAGWDKHIAQIDFDTLSGNVKFNVQNGYILPIDSTSLRLLGLLSFQNITKLFDVFKKTSQDGFAFDTLEGQAKITRGVMKLDTVKLTSPPLDATISGDINLKQETQNLHLLVKPRVDIGNVSTLYAVLINPLVGLGTLALGLFANKAFTIDYQVTGTFDKPVLQKN